MSQPRLSLWIFVAVALSLTSVAHSVVVVRDSPITLPLIKRFRAHGRNRTLVEHDRARILARAAGRNVDVSSYILSVEVNVKVGSPATQYSLLLDTGSSSTWVGGNKPYVPTSTSVNTGNAVSFMYGRGMFSGTQYLDQVDLGNGLVIPQQGLGVANYTEDLNGLDGMLGLGPVDLTVGSLTPDSTTPVPTVTDNLFNQGSIAQNIISVYIQPFTTSVVSSGTVTFGGVDESKITGPVHYTPRTEVHNSTLWWGIEQTLTYGKSTTIFKESTAGILDTGSSLILLNPEAFAIYQSATGGVYDEVTGLLSFTQEQYAKLASLYFNINGVTFEFTPNAQIMPRKFNYYIGGKPDMLYGVVADLGIPRHVEPVFNSVFVNGMVFLERFYSVYDTANNRLGLAETAYTYADVN